VKSVNKNSVVVTEKDTGKTSEIPFGMCVWSTGIKQTPLVEKFIQRLGTQNQPNRYALLVDSHLKVKGTENVFAIGDCSTLETNMLKKEYENLFHLADKNGDGQLSKDEIISFIREFSEKYSQLEIFTTKIEKHFEQFDTDKSGELSLEEFKLLVAYADNEIKLLPSTAQVAAQQGKYLGKALSGLMQNKPVEKFKYHHLGAFAYIGESEAVGEIPGMLKGGGMAVWWLWRAMYLYKQVSLRSMILVSFDWTKTLIFGRDVSRF